MIQTRTDPPPADASSPGNQPPAARTLLCFVGRTLMFIRDAPAWLDEGRGAR